MVYPASAVYVCLVVGVILLATTAVAIDAGVTNASAAAGSSNTAKARVSPAASASASNSDQYICYLCRERNTLMIKWCPLDVDDCHIACLSSPASTRALSPPGAHDDGDGERNALGTGPGGANGDDCYVLKLYPDGSWKIVYAVSCKAVAGCYLACGDGDDDAGGNTSPAVARGPLQPLLDAKFQRCGDQLTAAVPAVSSHAGVPRLRRLFTNMRRMACALHTD